MIFDLTLAGFNGHTDTTDHLVKWVKAPHREAVVRFAAAHGLEGYTLDRLEGRDDYTFEDGVDVQLDYEGNVIAHAPHVEVAYWKDEKPLDVAD